MIDFYQFCCIVIELIIVLVKATWLLLVRLVQAVLPTTRKSVEGEIVLVTGAGHGIGCEIAQEFARKGAYVVLWDINQKGNTETLQKIKRIGGKATAFVCDVTDKDMVKKVAQQVREKVGDVTILVNNAGILGVQPYTKHSEQLTRKIMEVNVMAHFWTIGEFLPQMMEMHHGHIVGISSIAGKLPFTYLVPYCTSKYAVTGMMETLSEELRYLKDYPDIHFSTVYPSLINTGLFKSARIKYDWLINLIEPEEVGKWVVDGVQCNMKSIYCPPSMEYFIKFLSLVPISIRDHILDTLDMGLNPQD